MRYTTPLHDDMGSAVLQHLRRFVTFPARGFVGGQAVASALDDLYGAGGGVYNDVDVFIRAPRFTKPRERLVLLPSRFETQIVLDLPPGADYGHVAMQHTVVAAPTYTISGVRRNDLLNEIFYATDKILGPLESARCVLSSFDINAVRVGVDLETGQLLWDVAFAQFARTSELRLCALHTPYHSLVRLLRKHRELPNVTVNIEASASLVGVLSTPDVRRSIEEYNAATFWFGAKYAEQARAVQSDMRPFFKLRSQHRYYDDIAHKVRPGFGDETNAPYELSTLVRRGDPGVACSPQIGGSLLDMMRLPHQVYAHFNAPASARIVVPAAPWQTKVLESPPLAAQHEIWGSGYLGAWTGPAPAQVLSKLLAPRVDIANRLQSLDGPAQLALMVGVRAHLVASGVPDVDDVMDMGASHGVTTDKASWLRGCDSVMDRQRKRLLGPLAVPTVLDTALWDEWPDAKVVVLTSERMLREWYAQHGWGDAPPYISDTLWIASDFGRHSRDTSLMLFSVDRTTRLLLPGRYKSILLRERMPVTMQAGHRRLWLRMNAFARSEGWFSK